MRLTTHTTFSGATATEGVAIAYDWTVDGNIIQIYYGTDPEVDANVPTAVAAGNCAQTAVAAVLLPNPLGQYRRIASGIRCHVRSPADTNAGYFVPVHAFCYGRTAAAAWVSYQTFLDRSQDTTTYDTASGITVRSKPVAETLAFRIPIGTPYIASGADGYVADGVPGFIFKGLSATTVLDIESVVYLEVKVRSFATCPLPCGPSYVSPRWDAIFHLVTAMKFHSKGDSFKSLMKKLLLKGYRAGKFIYDNRSTISNLSTALIAALA
jgi:hypothetical protein